jgi:T5orf172 domain
MMGCIFFRCYKKTLNKNNLNIITKPDLPDEIKFYLQKNDQFIQNKFISLLNSDLNKTESPGFIYGFSKKSDENSREIFWIKIGRTINPNPNKRVNQWKGDIEFCQKTLFNIRIESLIHLLFKYANIIRINEKTGCKEIEWFKFDKTINGNTNVPKIISILIEHVEDIYLSKI